MRYIFDAICPAGREKNLYHIATVRKNGYIAFYISREQSEHIAKKGLSMENKTIKELAIELTVEITLLCDGLKGRSVFTNQLLRSCSSIGANSHEAKYAQSKADFINKLEVALKECHETEYWLEILYRVGSIDEVPYKTLLSKCGTIRRKLIASITTVKNKNASAI